MNSHRGLASVVGAVFLIAIVIGALSYITYSIGIMGNFSEALITEESRLKDKQSEAFQITSIDFTAANKLDVVIKNTGQIPLKITTLYIDEMGVNDVVNKTTINKTISPGSSFDFLSESIDIDIDPTKGYNLKLITSRGETQTFYLNSASQEPLDIRLIVLPDRIPTGFDTTLIMVVVNNMSNNNPLINLTPIEPACSGICEKLSGPTPLTYDTLNAGDIAIFEWSYALVGNGDDSITFTSGIENGFPGNTDSKTVTIKTVELSETAGTSITSLGFGQAMFAKDLLVLHTETYGVPVESAPPDDWCDISPTACNADWNFRKLITIDNTKVSGSTNLSDFPFLISFTGSDFTDVEAETQSLGQDIRFTDKEGNILNWEIEKYDETSNDMAIWVKSNSTGLSSSVDTVLYMYYGNSGASPFGDPTDVWDSSYKGVWHLNQISGTLKDSVTGTTNECTNTGLDLDDLGVIDAGVRSDAGSDDLTCGTDSSLQPANAITFSGWMKSIDVELDQYGALGGIASTTGWKDGYGIWFQTNNEVRFQVSTGYNTNVAFETITTVTDWNYVVGTYDKDAGGTDEVKIYINGVLSSNVDDYSEVIDYQGGSFQMSEFGTWGGNEFNGYIDEVRISDSARTADWILTEYNNQNSPETFITINAQDATTGTQMSPNIPEQSGTTIIFDDTSDSFQWFSANVTVAETTIAAGVWNASLRYNSDRLPSGMAAGASDIHDSGVAGGHTLHFNTDITTARKDSSQDGTCTALVASGSLTGATWWPTYGVNGSGVYYFDGNNDYIIIPNGASKKCNYPDDQRFSISGWVKGNITATNDLKQFILYKWDVTEKNTGGIQVYFGDDTSNNHGVVYFKIMDSDLNETLCESDEPDGNGGNNYLDNNWHHFAAVEYAAGKCKLYIDGVEKDDVNGSADNKKKFDDTDDMYIGANRWAAKELTGYIDDLMFWNNYALTASDVTALYQHSFGENSTRLNVYLSNATGAGTTDEILASDENYGFPWVDPMTHTDVDDLWAGGNWTSAVSEVILGIDEPYSRLNFTLSYASGATLNLRVDDSNIDGTVSTLISSYLQVPGVNPSLPVFHVHDRDDKVTFFAYIGEPEGVWFTYQGTRVIFNGTNGHYTGIVDTVSYGVNALPVNATADSHFIDENVSADIVFWHPQSTPTASQPSENEKIPIGTYDVNIYLNGYDEDGTIFIRTINLGSVQVVD